MSTVNARGAQPMTYSGWRQEHQGIYLGMTGRQLAVCLAALAPAVLAVGAQAWGMAAVLLLLGVLTCAMVAVPVLGRTSAQWLRDAARFSWGRMFGVTAFRPKAATGLASPADLARPDWPGTASRLVMHIGEPKPPLAARVVMIHDPRTRRWSITGQVHHDGIAARDAAARDGYAAGLGQLLASMAQAQKVARVVLYSRSVPEDGAERALWLADRIDPHAPAMLHESGDLLERALRTASVRMEHFITVSVDEDKIRGLVREAGGDNRARSMVLYRVINEVEEHLRACGVTSVEWLTAPRLADAVKTGFDPAAAAGIADSRLRAARGQDVHTSTLPGASGPAKALPPSARRYTHDGHTSVSFTLLLPDRAVPVGSLARLLTPSAPGERRALALHYEPLAPASGQKRVGATMWSEEMAADLRQRTGLYTRLSDASRRRQASEHELDLNAGHEMVRTAGAVCLTVPGEAVIEDAVARLETDARAVGFSLLRLQMAQDAGFVAAVLPLGLGLPERGDR